MLINRLKSTISILLIITSAGLLTSFNKQSAAIKWLTIEQAETLSRTTKRKIFVDLYTDWCGWCKVMDRKSFAHPVNIALMNKYFYAVKFNAESQNPVFFNGTQYLFQGAGGRGTHQFASTFGRGQGGMSYPTTLYFDENLSIIQAIPGYLDPPMMEKVLTYFGEKYPERGVDWPTFEKTFVGKIEPEPK